MLPKKRGRSNVSSASTKKKPGSIKGLKDLAGDTNPYPDARLKATLMVLISCFVIPTGDESTIKGDYVQFVEKLEDVDNYAWGAALLAYLYEGIRKWKEVGNKKSVINGILWVILVS
jgi:hypothetical protein